MTAEGHPSAGLPIGRRGSSVTPDTVPATEVVGSRESSETAGSGGGDSRIVAVSGMASDGRLAVDRQPGFRRLATVFIVPPDYGRGTLTVPLTLESTIVDILSTCHHGVQTPAAGSAPQARTARSSVQTPLARQPGGRQ